MTQPFLLLNGEVFLWNPPEAPKLQAGISAGNDAWSAWLDKEEGRDRIWKVLEIVTPKPGTPILSLCWLQLRIAMLSSSPFNHTEILLFGTGATTLPVPSQIRAYLGGQLGIQLDVQDSRNAASTYNMLREEGRRVALALLVPVPSKS